MSDKHGEQAPRVALTEEHGACRLCGKALLWVDTANGKRMPLDQHPDRGYVLDAGKSPMVARQRNVYACHFDTCKKRGK